MPTLPIKEAEILHQLARRPSLSQRELARNTGFSLGLINYLLRRLANQGLITTSRVNKRKLDYRLTEKGRREAGRSSQATAAQTLDRYERLQEGVSGLLLRLHSAGYTYFSIHGDGHLRRFVLEAIRFSLADAPVSIGQAHRPEPQSVVLNLDPEGLDKNFKGDVVNVFEEIGKV